MNNIFLSSATFLYGMMWFVSEASLSTNCQIPPDLNIHYERLTAAIIGNKFLMSAKYISSSVNQTLHRGETTCPSTLIAIGEIKDRSSCPWYNKIITDSTLYPAVRSEAVCRCEDCIGSVETNHCETVYHEMLFLQRTPVCVDGMLVYEPIRKPIPTGCICAQKSVKTDYDV